MRVYGIPWFVGTLMTDHYSGETVLHRHLLGGSTMRIREFHEYGYVTAQCVFEDARDMPKDERQKELSRIKFNYTDLWARIPQDVAHEIVSDYDMTSYARAMRGESSRNFAYGQYKTAKSCIEPEMVNVHF